MRFVDNAFALLNRLNTWNVDQRIATGMKLFLHSASNLYIFVTDSTTLKFVANAHSWFTSASALLGTMTSTTGLTMNALPVDASDFKKNGRLVYGAAVVLNYNGSTNTINKSFGVSSVTDNGTGTFTINFSTAFADANYIALAVSSNSATDTTEASAAIVDRATGSARIDVEDSSASNIDAPINDVAIWGV